MMNFTAFNPTRLHFGQGACNELGSADSNLGKHALLVYGGGSVKRNGSYSDTVAQLEKAKIRITEFDGIKPNPRVDDVTAAAALPLLAVLTLAATGTEMNGTAVLQNRETREKIGFKSELMYPAWIKAMRGKARERIEYLGLELFDTADVDLTAEAFKALFSGLGSPVKCQEVGIEPSQKEEILQLMNQNKSAGIHYSLSDGEREEILNAAFN